MKKIMAFRQLRSRRAFARYSSAILACGVLATIPNASCTKNNVNNNQQVVTQSIPVDFPKSQESAPTDLSKIDIDMTKMSSTMIYAEVFNMLIMPEEYTDKLIKVSGNFQVFEDEQNGERYFAIIIPDATKCCQQGIEFVWQGEHSYPSDYPQIGQEITITGTYNCVENAEGLTYTYLDVWDLNYCQ